jgi:prepilin-type N-terminal cleavage/methylation domain-containing protein/prepilin-type processing-associated H-X9-DG protein
MNTSFSRLPGRVAAGRAFTLIELLVVIAIIAVLVALLFPVFGGMLRKGQQTTSASNLRNWASGFNASVGENDGEMPTSGWVNSSFSAADPDAWFNRIPRAMKDRPLADFVPATTPQLGERSIWINPAVPTKTATPGNFIFCYGYNEKLVQTSKEGDRPLKIALLEFPSLTVLMGEKADKSPQLTIGLVRAYFGSGDPLLAPDNEANFLFCDGHVEAVKRKIFGDELLTNASDALKNRQTTFTWLYKQE